MDAVAVIDNMEADDIDQLHPEELEQEYEAQYFGCTPISVIDGVYDTKDILVHESIITLYKIIVKKYNATDKESIKKGCEGLRVDIMKSVNKICDKLELYLLSYILHIPSNVLLPEDKIQRDTKFKMVDESMLDEKLKELQIQINEVAVAIAHSYRAKHRLDNLVRNHQEMLDTLLEMERCFKDAGLNHLDKDIDTIKSKATELLDNMATLQPMIIE